MEVYLVPKSVKAHALSVLKTQYELSHVFTYCGNLSSVMTVGLGKS